jgi:CTP synthase
MGLASKNVKKYIFVTGGVISGLGKGIVVASLGRLLKARGYAVTMQKFDPYFNVDAGTINPFEHGEVFVTDDGAETDLDLGHYERFIDEELTRNGNITSGSIYGAVIRKERQGVYDGATVQIVPHITDEIKERIALDAPGADIALIEIGGTVGDIESMVFLEAIRQLSNDVGKEHCAFVHVVLMPYVQASGEQKTKPAQHSVKELLGLGISPDFIVCRSERPLTDDSKGKVSLFCNVPRAHVVTNEDVESIYEVPLRLHAERLDAHVLAHLGLKENREPDLAEWRAMVERQKSPGREVTVALVGKYVESIDAYLSVAEALRHSGAQLGAKVLIKLVDSESLAPETVGAALAGVGGVVVPGGFGSRGIEGMILAAGWAREQKVPYFGLCLGMQVAAVEFARNVLGLADAYFSEYAPKTANPVIDWMPEQKNVKMRGGTMRLGGFPCALDQGSIAHSCYGAELISERHRHRYEFNNSFRERFELGGMALSGKSPDSRVVEICELARELHPWFVGVQFHPEFKSRPNRPHPLFCGFIEASAANSTANSAANSIANSIGSNAYEVKR